MNQAAPVILFVYARPTHLVHTLTSIRENKVPRLWVFADGAKGNGDERGVAEVRALLRTIDWCEVSLVEREKNLGLGRNVIAGVTAMAEAHDAFIVWEDDLVAVSGTYAWMSAALRHYANDERVMSVSGWTHPRVTPAGLAGAPYFDARGECWVWGTWAKRWAGMSEESTLEKMARAAARGIQPDAYGMDLPAMAREEARKNIWAVRWLYHHFASGGLCLRPPWSMVEHIGFDRSATNAAGAESWANPPLREVPPIPEHWPEPLENADCRAHWQREADAPPPWWARIWRRLSVNRA